MKNLFEIRGDEALVFLEHRTKGKFTALIDVEDLPKLMEYPNHWNANVQKDGKVYVVTTLKGKSVKLHRILIECEKGMVVDHINGEPLDNRKCNLRQVSNKENQQNRQGAQRNSKSGVRGVVWVEERKKWKAYVRVDGKQIHLGIFKDIEDADKAARKGRERYMEIPKEREAL